MRTRFVVAAVRDARYLYVEYPGTGETELYDMRRDPTNCGPATTTPATWQSASNSPPSSR